MKSLGRFLGGVLLFFLIWHLAATLLQTSIILPAPYQVLKVLAELLRDPLTGVAALQTVWKVFLALALVLALGLFLGIGLGTSPALYEMMRPLIMVIQAVPVVSWLSLVIFAWGIGWRGPIFIAFMSLLPIALLTTVSGVKNLDRKLLEVARVYRVPRRQVIKDIYLGALVPFMFAVVDVSIGQAWKVILVAEYLCGNSGLGVEILSARFDFDIPRVYAFTLLAVTLGILTERGIKRWLERTAKKWQPA